MQQSVECRVYSEKYNRDENNFQVFSFGSAAIRIGGTCSHFLPK